MEGQTRMPQSRESESHHLLITIRSTVVFMNGMVFLSERRRYGLSGLIEKASPQCIMSFLRGTAYMPSIRLNVQRLEAFSNLLLSLRRTSLGKPVLTYHRYWGVDATWSTGVTLRQLPGARLKRRSPKRAIATSFLLLMIWKRWRGWKH